MPTLTGITKNNVGAILGSCDAFLFKYDGAGTLTQIGNYTTSDPSTGVYTFSPADTDPSYLVLFFKDGSPNVFDATDHVLQPV